MKKKINPRKLSLDYKVVSYNKFDWRLRGTKYRSHCQTPKAESVFDKRLMFIKRFLKYCPRYTLLPTLERIKYVNEDSFTRYFRKSVKALTFDAMQYHYYRIPVFSNMRILKFQMKESLQQTTTLDTQIIKFLRLIVSSNKLNSLAIDPMDWRIFPHLLSYRHLKLLKANSSLTNFITKTPILEEYEFSSRNKKILQFNFNFSMEQFATTRDISKVHSEIFGRAVELHITNNVLTGEEIPFGNYWNHFTQLRVFEYKEKSGILSKVAKHLTSIKIMRKLEELKLKLILNSKKNSSPGVFEYLSLPNSLKKLSLSVNAHFVRWRVLSYNQVFFQSLSELKGLESFQFELEIQRMQEDICKMFVNTLLDSIKTNLKSLEIIFPQEVMISSIARYIFTQRFLKKLKIEGEIDNNNTVNNYLKNFPSKIKTLSWKDNIPAFLNLSKISQSQLEELKFLANSKYLNSLKESEKQLSRLIKTISSYTGLRILEVSLFSHQLFNDNLLKQEVITFWKKLPNLSRCHLSVLPITINSTETQELSETLKWKKSIKEAGLYFYNLSISKTENEVVACAHLELIFTF